MSDNEYWFPAKKYGWGWGIPSRWQGWAVMIGYVVLMSVGVVFIRPEQHIGWYLAYVAVLTAALLLVCWIKGEPPEWRWGNDRK